MTITKPLIYLFIFSLSTFYACGSAEEETPAGDQMTQTDVSVEDEGGDSPDGEYIFDNSTHSEDKIEHLEPEELNQPDSRYADMQKMAAEDLKEKNQAQSQVDTTDSNEIKYVSMGEAYKQKAYAIKGNILEE